MDNVDNNLFHNYYKHMDNIANNVRNEYRHIDNIDNNNIHNVNYVDIMFMMIINMWIMMIIIIFTMITSLWIILIIITFTMVTTNRAETVPEDLFSLAKTETRLSHGRVLIRRWILTIIYTDDDIY